MKTKTILYWCATIPVAFMLGSGGIGDVMRPDFLVKTMVRLGYPPYFCLILGVWKILGTVAILAPGFGRLKEWAYAGTIFFLTGAMASHLAMHSGFGDIFGPAVFTVLTLISWWLRPADRKMQNGRQLLETVL